MTGRLVLATRNAHKVAELQRILSVAGLAFVLVGLDDFPDVPDVAETESTFAGNALLKARSVARATGLPAVADDSGLCVDALNGMPGVLSARWSGVHGDDPANLQLVLAQVRDVPPARRGAQFVCAAAYADPAGSEFVVEGALEGSLAEAPRGSHGFGYDPIFVPDGYAVTTAELRPEEKDAISHRGHAFRALAQVLRGDS
ncbi:MAG: RdgB/HAM1 family non-canonical purine NTP pyrophosphatase [bacterium]